MKTLVFVGDFVRRICYSSLLTPTIVACSVVVQYATLHHHCTIAVRKAATIIIAYVATQCAVGYGQDGRAARAMDSSSTVLSDITGQNATSHHHCARVVVEATTVIPG